MTAPLLTPDHTDCIFEHHMAAADDGKDIIEIERAACEEIVRAQHEATVRCLVTALREREGGVIQTAYMNDAADWLEGKFAK